VAPGIGDATPTSSSALPVSWKTPSRSAVSESRAAYDAPAKSLPNHWAESGSVSTSSAWSPEKGTERSHVRLPSGVIVPAVDTPAFSAARNVACSPACSGTSIRVITPSPLGEQIPDPPVPVEPPPVPVPVPLLLLPVEGAAQVPSALQTPEAQSAPTWHMGGV